MSELNNIDKLLKESFSEFTPDAPDVWQGIEQGVQAAQAGQIAGAVKGGMGIVAKIVTVVAVSATLVTGYILLADKKDESQVTQATTQHSQAPIDDVQQHIELEEAPSIDQPTVDVPEQTTVRQPVIANADRSDNGAGTYSRVKTDKPVIKNEVNTESNKNVESGSGKANSKTPDASARPQTNTTSGTAPANKNINHEQPSVPKEEENKEAAGLPVENNQDLLKEDANPFVPNVFSPNGDGLNDNFVIVIEEETLYFLRVYDQKGHILFESDNKENTWDGKDRNTGSLCSKGMYIYEFTYQLRSSSSPTVKRGVFKLY